MRDLLCPMCCAVCDVREEDPSTWENCIHEEDPLCVEHEDEVLRWQAEDYIADVRAEWESEVRAAATMDDYLYV